MPARQQLSILRHLAATVTAADGKKLPLRQRPLQNAGFTMLELIVVIGTIIILVAVVLGAAGYVQKKGSRSRAETEIAALSAALESYKADNGIYPTTTNTNSLYPRTATDVTTYSAASLDLYKALSGDTDGDRIVDAGKSYFAFTPAQLAPSAQGQPVQFIRDPFGNSYGYSTAANPTANPSPSPSPSPAGYNPTFDLWSTGGYTPPSATPTPTPQDFWIKNW